MYLDPLCFDAPIGANLYPPGVWFADAMGFFSGVTFVLFCFVFRLYAFVEAATLHSIVLRYAGVPIATRIRLFGFASFFVSMLSLKSRPFIQSSFDMQAFR